MNKLSLSIPLVLASALAACADNDGPLERVGEEIDEAAEDVQAGGETVGNQIDDALDDVEQAAEEVTE